MVDSEDSPKTSDMSKCLRSIAEDNEYFKRMLSLVPQHILQEKSYEKEESEPEDENVSSTGKEAVSSITHKKSKKQRKKERKQKEKEKHSTENSAQHMQPEKQPKKRKNEEHEVKVTDEVDASDMPTNSTNENTDSHFTQLKHKKPRLDLSSETSTKVKTGTEIQESFSNFKSDQSPKHKLSHKHKKKQNVSKHSTVNDSEQNSKQSNGAHNNLLSVPSPSTPDKVMDTSVLEADTLVAASISGYEDKRAKLRAKIEELQAKRKPSSKDRLDKKKLKRKESKMKLKQKRKLEKLQKKQNQSNTPKNKGNLNKGTSPVKPIYNKEGQVVYSKFDFTDSGKKEKKHSDLGGKDYKRLLEKIEKRNEKINKLKRKDESAGKSLEDKFKWQAAMNKAEGAKVKDNPEMLKKSLKRKEKMKEQKKKKWESRVQQVDKMKDEKQKKRTENIQKRKQSVKDKKLKKLKKKGRIIPGF